MFDVRMVTPTGSIRLNLDGLVLRQGDTYVFLTRQEYMWLPEYHERGTDITITNESGAITLMPHVADAIVSLISNIVDYCEIRYIMSIGGKYAKRIAELKTVW